MTESLLEQRVSEQGKVIDDHTERIAKLEIADKFREDQINRMEKSLNSISGKLDSMSVQMMQIAQMPMSEKSEKWDKFGWHVFTLVIGAVVGYLLVKVGLQ